MDRRFHQLFFSAVFAAVSSATLAAEITPLGPFAALETPEQSVACYSLCKRSFDEILQASDKTSLKECEARQKCVSRLPFGPDHGAVAGMPKEQPRDLLEILEDIVGITNSGQI